MKHRYTGSILFSLAALCASAQPYCSPTFLNGCFSWANLAVTGGELNWSLGTDDCSLSDYTAQSVTMGAGEPVSMSVTSGTWTGCAVWIDLDNDYDFATGENVYYAYVGGSPSYTYDFNVTVPGATPTGNYRMRIVAGWGSDGFLDTNTNGYGPCGSYQYGNFTDFNVNVIGTTGLIEASSTAGITVSPNPATDLVTISGNTSLDDVVVMDAQGRMVVQQREQGDRLVLDTRSWADGVYVVRISNADGVRTQRVVVE